METKSAKYETLKRKWDMGYITLSTLRGWVRLNEARPGAGITAAEFQEITGAAYEEAANE